MRHGSLFSGIGGFDLAAEWCGWENVFHCEINPFCQQVLKHYWPNAECYDDIKKTDFTKWRGTIDIISGGFPCQPYSHAGQRKGKDDERHLWPEMLRAIREIEPSYIVGENVRGLISWNGGMVFDEVQTDLELAGYEVAAVVIPAAGVNAPHGRDRVWFVAYSEHNAKTKNGGTIGGTKSQIRGNNTGDVFGGFCDDGYVADTNGIGHSSCGKGTKVEGSGSGNNGEQEKRGEQAQRIDGLFGFQRDVADTSGIGFQPTGKSTKLERGRPGFNYTQNNQPTWDNFPTQSPICGGNDGLPTQLDGITFPKWRNESIKGYGNAVVPQVVYQIFQCLMNLESKSNA